ncbi:MAG: glycerol-3-phosphate dehydrogenase/oxidase [Acidobacteria bacterium]|nr:glycerol-3-phosphate dehydrogenase/oxidase [Acidobacteriota bacterium]
MSGFAEDLRAKSIATLRDGIVDVLIIGGGINGAGIARDLGLRKQQAGVAFDVAVVDQGHFASGTSGRNSHLIHGGLRYLKYLKLGLVKESLRERMVLRSIAPHLVEPLAFVMPMYSRVDKLKFLMGLTLYDQLAGDGNISKHRAISKGELQQLEPHMSSRGLVGGAIFYDCRVNSSRFVLENLFDAAASGVHVANYVKAEPISRGEEGIWKVRLEDALFGGRYEARARKVIDATGAWSEPEGAKPRLVRGSHLILPRLTSDEHAVAFFDDDGRIVFLIPWGSEKQWTLLGTTDVEHTDGPGKVSMTKAEEDYLLGIAQKLYPGASSYSPIAAFSSLRPLVDDGSASSTAASREHKIFNTKDGILRIQGGKYTTYRQVSEEAVDLLLKEVAPWLQAKCRTAEEPLCGNSEKAVGKLMNEAAKMAAQFQLARIEVEQLIRDYGVHTAKMMEFLPADHYGPITRTQYARMAFAVQHEMTLRLPDVMYGSTYLGWDRAWDAASLEPYAYLMGTWLGWDAARQAREIMSVLQMSALPGKQRRE